MPLDQPDARDSAAEPSVDARSVAEAEAGELSTVWMWTDGACKGNPGVGGWGAWLQSGDHEREIFGGDPSTTNNRMELTAVIEGLNALTRRCRVILHVDSSYVKNGIEQWLAGWKRNGWRTAAKQPVKNAELWRQLDTATQRHEISWRWVKGHSGDPGNEHADALANRGVESVLSGTC